MKLVVWTPQLRRKLVDRAENDQRLSSKSGPTLYLVSFQGDWGRGIATAIGGLRAETHNRVQVLSLSLVADSFCPVDIYF